VSPDRNGISNSIVYRVIRFIIFLMPCNEISSSPSRSLVYSVCRIAHPEAVVMWCDISPHMADEWK